MRLKHLTVPIAIAGALAVPAAIAASASASPAAGTSSAFGLAATGLVNVPATPAVSSATAPYDQSLFDLSSTPLGKLVKLKVLHTSATGDRSRASVVDLRVPQAALSAHLITAKCQGGQGSSQLVKASLGGKRLAVDAAPNSTVTVPVQGVGTVSATLNKQVKNADGSLTVTAIEVKLTLATGQGQTIAISSATCSAGDPSTPPKPTPTPTNTPPGQAPVPTPVPTDLPVTG